MCSFSQQRSITTSSPASTRPLRGRSIDHAFLQPHCFRANRNRLIDCFARLVRTPKDINQIDLLRHRTRDPDKPSRQTQSVSFGLTAITR